MSRRADPALALAALAAEDRATVERWASMLGADAWPSVPSLAVLVPLLACVRMAGDMDLDAPEALREAADVLGMDPDSVARQLRRIAGARTCADCGHELRGPRIGLCDDCRRFAVRKAKRADYRRRLDPGPLPLADDAA